MDEVNSEEQETNFTSKKTETDINLLRKNSLASSSNPLQDYSDPFIASKRNSCTLYFGSIICRVDI